MTLSDLQRERPPVFMQLIEITAPFSSSIEVNESTILYGFSMKTTDIVGVCPLPKLMPRIVIISPSKGAVDGKFLV